MNAPDRIWARQMATGFRGAIGTWNVCEHDDIDRDEYIRRDPAVLATLPEVQVMIRQAVEAEREACARLVDCGCDAAKKVAVLRADNGTERARACGEYACGADDAAAIRKRTEG